MKFIIATCFIVGFITWFDLSSGNVVGFAYFHAVGEFVDISFPDCETDTTGIVGYEEILYFTFRVLLFPFTDRVLF